MAHLFCRFSLRSSVVQYSNLVVVAEKIKFNNMTADLSLRDSLDLFLTTLECIAQETQ